MKAAMELALLFVIGFAALLSCSEAMPAAENMEMSNEHGGDRHGKFLGLGLGLYGGWGYGGWGYPYGGYYGGYGAYGWPYYGGYWG